MWIQPLNRNLILFVLIIFLGSCTTLKNISFPMNNGKVSKTVEIKKSPRTMEFLEDISVTPGKITINNASDAVETEKPAVINKNYEMMPVNLSDIEKANWLQIKYSLKMDIAVEEIKNIPLLQKIDEWWGTPYVLGGNSMELPPKT